MVVFGFKMYKTSLKSIFLETRNFKADLLDVSIIIYFNCDIRFLQNYYLFLLDVRF